MSQPLHLLGTPYRATVSLYGERVVIRQAIPGAPDQFVELSPGDIKKLHKWTEEQLRVEKENAKFDLSIAIGRRVLTCA